MRKISAHYIFPVSSKPLKKGIIVFDDDGKIIDLIDTKGDLKETSGVEFFNGIIVPGFVNTHCHLELSYLKDIIPRKTGHAEFIKQIVKNIQSIEPDIQKIKNADIEMQREGIVAVGDISNRDISFEVKNNSPIYYHTFIEIADFFDDHIAKNEITKAKKLSNSIKNSSIVAHAPYTSSPEFIANTAKLSSDVYSIHNQEVATEDEMCKSAMGEMFELMSKRSILKNFKPTGKTSLQSYLHKITREDFNIILIHNLFSTDEDLLFAEKKSKNIYWSLCPNSNIYIQNKLPNIKNFINNNCKITLGTDSLSTNSRLSIIEEMKNFKEIDFNKVLKWATINGAKALKVENKFGSIEIGKTPGLNLISEFDFEKNHLKNTSSVKKII